MMRKRTSTCVFLYEVYRFQIYDSHLTSVLIVQFPFHFRQKELELLRQEQEQEKQNKALEAEQQRAERKKQEELRKAKEKKAKEERDVKLKEVHIVYIEALLTKIGVDLLKCLLF